MNVGTMALTRSRTAAALCLLVASAGCDTTGPNDPVTAADVVDSEALRAFVTRAAETASASIEEVDGA